MLNRKLKNSVCALVLTTMAAAAWAWPDKPVTIVVPWPPGGPSDIAARPMAKGLGEALKQPFLIENKPGAGGNIGTAAVAHGNPDGHTLLITASGPIVINKHLYKKMPFDPQKQLQPVSNLLRVAQVLVVHPSLPVNNLRELMDYIQQQKGSFSWASAGNGTTQHMTGALFQERTGLNMKHIPYRGSAPAITDLVGGHVPMLIDSTIAVVPMIKSGKAKAIAVSGKQRSPHLPDVPTFQESGLASFESYAWYGLFAPANIPQSALGQLSQAAQTYMKSAEFQRVIADTGSDQVASDPATFSAFIQEEAARWEKLAPTLNLSLD
ncbi:tripartite tricarboxylate transporter substrate binding protein [Pantoea sp. 18069]|uniref:Bug family tripartite tricarboxylate transporter substrate binding protein n=1 Tax=Pantoea sp. 18069 TaxID=2681415 RepID=UPI001357B63D|nr:tripartite tricarboxylate transporter substrate binding protein [Pantoea sp. 18069]